MKKNVTKKLVAVALASAMAMTVVGCGDEAPAASSSAAPSSDAPAASSSAASSDAAGSSAVASSEAPKEIEKPESISWWTHDGLNEENGSEQWFAEFEKFTGIHLDHQFIPNNEYYDKLKLAFASHEVPEVFDLNGANLALYASQGAIKDLTPMLKSSGLWDKVDPEIWDAIAIDGKVYAVPKEVPSAACTYVRGDWLERLNMEVPKTYDEFLEMIRRFKAEIPECEIGLTAPGVKSPQNLPEFYQGAQYGFYRENGEWKDGFAQPNMADAMQRMQDAYKEGLLDMEIITNTTSTCRDAWYEGKVGVFNYWSGKWGGTLQERLVANNEGAVALAIEPISEATYSFATLSGLCISAEVSDEKAEQIFKYFFEYMHDGGEGQLLFQSGVEGVHWEQDGDNVKPLPNLADPSAVTTSVWITPWLSLTPMELTDKKVAQADAVVNSLAITDAVAVQTPITPVSETLNMITSDLELEKADILAKVVMGEMTVEQGVAAYEEVATELNVQKVLDELNGK